MREYANVWKYDQKVARKPRVGAWGVVPNYINMNIALNLKLMSNVNPSLQILFIA